MASELAPGEIKELKKCTKRKLAQTVFTIFKDMV